MAKTAGNNKNAAARKWPKRPEIIKMQPPENGQSVSDSEQDARIPPLAVGRTLGLQPTFVQSVRAGPVRLRNAGAYLPRAQSQGERPLFRGAGVQPAQRRVRPSGRRRPQIQFAWEESSGCGAWQRGGGGVLRCGAVAHWSVGGGEGVHCGAVLTGVACSGVRCRENGMAWCGTMW